MRFELARGGAEAAAGALAELEDPPDDLVQDVAAAQAARADDRAKMVRLEAQAAQLDPAIGRRTRVAVAGMLGVFWTLVPQVGDHYFTRQATHPWWQLYVMTIVMIAVSLLGVTWGWQSMTRTIVNRRIIGIGCTMLGMQLALDLGTARLGSACRGDHDATHGDLGPLRDDARDADRPALLALGCHVHRGVLRRVRRPRGRVERDERREPRRARLVPRCMVASG